MDPKMVPEFGLLSPKWGPENGTQKLVLDLNYVLISSCCRNWTPSLGAILWAPFRGSNSGTILGSIFGPPFGSKIGANLQKFCQSSSAWNILVTCSKK